MFDRLVALGQQLVSDQFAKAFHRVAVDGAARPDIFLHPGMGVFVGADGRERGSPQPEQNVNVVLELPVLLRPRLRQAHGQIVRVRKPLDAVQIFQALPVHEGEGDIGVRQFFRPGEHRDHVALDVLENALRLIEGQHGHFHIALAEEAAILQVPPVGLDGQLADTTFPLQLETIPANRLLAGQIRTLL